MRHIILILSILLYPTLCISQIFYDAAPDLGIVQYNLDRFFGAGCSTADWNRDGLSADINNTGVVDSIDFLDFLSSYGCIGACQTDINLDGQTTVDDLLQLLIEYGDSAC